MGKRFEVSRTAVRLLDETGVEPAVDGCAVGVGSVGDDDEFGAEGPAGPLVEPVCLASLSDYLEQVPVVRIVGATHEPLDPVDGARKKPDRREQGVDVGAGSRAASMTATMPSRRTGDRNTSEVNVRAIPLGSATPLASSTSAS
jgi:hypothetical protein